MLEKKTSQGEKRRKSVAPGLAMLRQRGGEEEEEEGRAKVQRSISLSNISL